MSDNTIVSSTDTIRDLDRSGTGIKTQVAQIDVGGATPNAESLVSSANPLPVQLKAYYNNPQLTYAPGSLVPIQADNNGSVLVNVNEPLAIDGQSVMVTQLDSAPHRALRMMMLQQLMMQQAAQIGGYVPIDLGQIGA